MIIVNIESLCTMIPREDYGTVTSNEKYIRADAINRIFVLIYYFVRMEM